jgi:hypothetical protein
MANQTALQSGDNELHWLIFFHIIISDAGLKVVGGYFFFQITPRQEWKRAVDSGWYRLGVYAGR